MSIRILVTGGSGLVGRGIQSVASNNDIFTYLSSVDGDLRDIGSVKKIFDKYKPTHVIHLAARVGGLFTNMDKKVEFFEDNMMINMNVLKCCKEYNVEKCVSCLSTCIFPDKTTFPIDETMIHNGPPHPSNEGYAYAKRMIDTLNRCYNEEYGCKFTSIIPTNIYGQYDNFSVGCGHVIPGLIHKAYIAKQNDSPFIVYGSGTPLRQFIYSIDLAKLILWTLDNYDNIDPIILSVDESDEISIKDLALLIAKEFDISDNMIQFDTSKADGQYKKTASNKKLRGILPDFQFTPIKDGLHETIEWFKKNYNTVRK